MDILLYAILVIILAACSWRSYTIGLREGANNMLDLLQHQKIISYDNEGNIRPNPLFSKD